MRDEGSLVPRVSRVSRGICGVNFRHTSKNGVTQKKKRKTESGFIGTRKERYL